MTGVVFPLLSSGELKTGSSPVDPGALVDTVTVVMPAFRRGQEIQCRSCGRVCLPCPGPEYGIKKDGTPFKKETYEGDVFEPGIQG